MNMCRTSDAYSTLDYTLAELFKIHVLKKKKISLARPGGVGLSIYSGGRPRQDDLQFRVSLDYRGGSRPAWAI